MFSTPIPPMPKDTGKVIGFIVHHKFDTRNIKVVKDIVHSVINNNMHASYVVSWDTEKERAIYWIEEFLKTFQVPEEKITRIPQYKEDSINKFYCAGVNAELLYLYKKLMGIEGLEAIYVFTDNKKATELVELINACRLYNIRVVTIDSEGEYTDYLDERLYMNERMFIEGRVLTNGFNIENKQFSDAVQRQRFAYRKGERGTAKENNPETKQ